MPKKNGAPTDNSISKTIPAASNAPAASTQTEPLLSEADVKARLALLGFTSKDEEWISNTSYQVKISRRSSSPLSLRVNYGKDIKVGHTGVCLLKREEDWVTLECVLRLLRKGYPARALELEKTWKLGHKGKGRLDVLIRTKTLKNPDAFAMIECKTWGAEYQKERSNVLEDGGQLFSYFIQERKTKTLILYASRFEGGKVDSFAETIDATTLKGGNTEELHNSWNKSFIPQGIFHDSAAPYFSEKKNLKKKDLKELDRDSGAGLFNSFAEVLRRHVISDKSNAFNKIFSLFVCKICDEDSKGLNDEVDFQWKVNDTPTLLIERLSDLYKRGLRDYLAIQAAGDFFSASAEFAFIDIYDEASFSENFAVVREVVELLQSYQLKYTSKHQFLGDFFESLLNTGIKQEAGQFFTPVPLARFFLRSLPLEQMIQENIHTKRQDVLPYILDYACGAGHFLTEAIDEIEQHIEKINPAVLLGKIQKKFIAIRENFYWAKDYVYGIEKDYRLAKTTKIALFLNGDGDATIIHGDGLDPFSSSRTFSGILSLKDSSRLNPVFDIIVSNPPFSIAGFKRYLKDGERSFALYGQLSPRSSEIECLFFERLYHLLREGACAGIILPLSILNSDVAVYRYARRKLLIDFDVVGLVELRDKTFSATNTTTIGLFVRKRNRKMVNDALAACYQHFVKAKHRKDIAEALAAQPGSDEVPMKELLEPYSGVANGTEQVESADLPTRVTAILISILNATKKTVIAYTGEKKEQEEFLGYRFSDRRGHEGIDVLKSNSLFNPADLNDETKASTHIRANYVGAELNVPDALKERLKYLPTLTIADPYSLEVTNPSSFFESAHIVTRSLSRFGDRIDDFPQKDYSWADLLKKDVAIVDGLKYTKKTDEVPWKTTKRVLTADNLDIRTGKLDETAKIIYLREDFTVPGSMRPRPGDIIVSKASGSVNHLGKCVYVDEKVDAVIGGFLFIIRPKTEAIGKAVYYRLLSEKFRRFVVSLRDQNINNMAPGKLASFEWQLPEDLDGFCALMKKRETDVMEAERVLRESERS